MGVNAEVTAAVESELAILDVGGDVVGFIGQQEQRPGNAAKG